MRLQRRRGGPSVRLSILICDKESLSAVCPFTSKCAKRPCSAAGDNNVVTARTKFHRHDDAVVHTAIESTLARRRGHWTKRINMGCACPNSNKNVNLSVAKPAGRGDGRGWAGVQWGTLHLELSCYD